MAHMGVATLRELTGETGDEVRPRLKTQPRRATRRTPAAAAGLRAMANAFMRKIFRRAGDVISCQWRQIHDCEGIEYAPSENSG